MNRTDMEKQTMPAGLTGAPLPQTMTQPAQDPRKRRLPPGVQGMASGGVVRGPKKHKKVKIC